MYHKTLVFFVDSFATAEIPNSVADGSGWDPKTNKNFQIAPPPLFRAGRPVFLTSDFGPDKTTFQVYSNGYVRRFYPPMERFFGAHKKSPKWGMIPTKGSNMGAFGAFWDLNAQLFGAYRGLCAAVNGELLKDANHMAFDSLRRDVQFSSYPCVRETGRH